MKNIDIIINNNAKGLHKEFFGALKLICEALGCTIHEAYWKYLKH